LIIKNNILIFAVHFDNKKTMKKTMKKLKLILILPLLLINSFVIADPPGPPGPGGTGGGVPVGSPIDNQTWILLAVCLIYAIYKIYELYKNKKKKTI